MTEACRFLGGGFPPRRAPCTASLGKQSAMGPAPGSRFRTCSSLCSAAPHCPGTPTSQPPAALAPQVSVPTILGPRRLSPWHGGSLLTLSLVCVTWVGTDISICAPRPGTSDLQPLPCGLTSFSHVLHTRPASSPGTASDDAPSAWGGPGIPPVVPPREKTKWCSNGSHHT